MGQLLRETEQDKLTIKEFFRGYNVKKALDSITSAWNEVIASTMDVVWKKVWPECVYKSIGIDKEDINPRNVQQASNDTVELAHKAGFTEIDQRDVEQLLSMVMQTE